MTSLPEPRDRRPVVRSGLSAVLLTLTLATWAPAATASPEGHSVRTWVEGSPRELERATWELGEEVVNPISIEAAEPWEITLWVDGETSSPATVRRAADLLLQQLDRIVDLGSLRIVRADPEARTVSIPARDRELVEQGLYELYFRPEAGDRLRHQRSRWVRGEAREAESMATSEAALLQRRRDALVAWLAAEGRSSAPRLLLLADDGLGHDPSEVYPVYGATPEATAPLAGDLAEVANAYGWVTAPLALAADRERAVEYRATEETPVGFRIGLGRDRPEELEPEPLAEDREIAMERVLTASLDALAEATGGTGVTDESSLRSLIDSLTARREVTLPWPSDRTDEVLPLTVRRPNGSPLTAPRSLAAAGSLQVAEMRVRSLLADRETGELPVDVLVSSVADRPESELAVRAEWSLLEAPLPPRLRVTTALRLQSGEVVYRHELVAPEPLPGGDLEYRSSLRVPETTETAVVVVEDPDGLSWGGGFARFTTRSGPEDHVPDWDRLTEPASRTVRILPLASEGTVEGRVQVTAETDESVRRVRFLFDGERHDDVGEAPFSTRVRLGRGGERHIVEAIAFDATDQEIGRDFLVLNETADTFWVRITSPESGDLVGPVTVKAEVQIPADEELERVDYYWRSELIATSRETPHERRVLIPYANPSGFLRVEAKLASGRTTEDVVLMNSARFGAQVDVEVVELFVVVTDRNGKPVRDLDSAAFEVVDSGEPQRVENVRLAGDLPLTVGLAIDSSSSLFAKLPRVQEAAAGFVDDLSNGRDEAFLVGFGNRPRVVQGSTRNLARVSDRIADLSAGGRTAVWEAVVLSLLQLQDVNGRKALVVFYDGDDEDEDFSYRTALSMAKETGVPIYLIVMNNTAARTNGQGFRTRSFTGRLERIAEAGGGRVYYVPTDADLHEIYRSISEELRSHYLITYTPDATPHDSVWRSVEVNVRGRGLEARTLSGYEATRP